MTQSDQLHSIESAGKFLGGISPSTIRVWISVTFNAASTTAPAEFQESNDQ
jgi:hypothetical protein